MHFLSRKAMFGRIKEDPKGTFEEAGQSWLENLPKVILIS